MEKQESNFLYHTPCNNCGSSDANSVYDDGHTYCFSCNTTTRGNDLTQPKEKTSSEFISGTVVPLVKRKKSGRVGRPIGVGVAERGFGKAMKNG